MTVKEAILRLKDHFRIHDDGRPTPYLDEAVGMAYEALEKQVPKKPTSIIRIDCFVGYCPCCGNVVTNAVNTIYCNCGQKLDWD